MSEQLEQHGERILYQYSELKERHREIRDSLPTNQSLRVHRSLSWLQCAEQQDNKDAQFIFLWIAFNASYAHEIDNRQQFKERRVLMNFFKLLLDVDHGTLLYDVVWNEFQNSIRVLISNQYVFQKYWDFQNLKISEQEWRDAFEASKVTANRALGRMDTMKVMAIVFDRLYTLRNQLIHGGATWNGSVNREQIRDGVSILGKIVPTIIHLMINNKPRIIGQPCYPVVK